MDIELRNEQLTLTVSDQGAEMTRLTKDGHDYLWSGDPTYWKEHAPVLFPFVGRLTDETYRISQKEYHIPMHGFAKRSTFSIIKQVADSITLELTDSDATRESYPYAFSFQVRYTLVDNKVAVHYHVENRSEETMYFGLGGHPGFRVPMEEGLTFEDYRLRFADKCIPDQISFSPTVFQTGTAAPCSLENGTDIPLHHDLFDNDAVVLQNMADEVTICSDLGYRSVTVRFPQMPYVGFWHKPHTDAPYVCIEPWSCLPARQDIIEDIRYKVDLTRLAAGRSYDNVWWIILN